MNVHEVRSKYLEFFKARGHAIIPSASLVPQNDPTTLFTGSGMQPMLPYFLGEPHPEGVRIADSQKSFRSEDIEEVGDNRHTTFFEMLGNWSLGDYFKQEQLRWCFEFLTEEVGIPAERLWVTCFEGDEALHLPRDTESADIWQSLGIPPERIRFYAKKNWWSRAGTPENMPAGEPGGPDSEVFFECTDAPHDPQYGAACHPNCDCGRFMEICNSVFMQYIKNDNGSFGELPKRNVDFGGGLERITAAAHNDPDIFHTDVFADVIALLVHFSGKEYRDPQYQRSFRIIADHMRAATFMLADGVRPSNTAQGYILRRLIRRAAQHAQKLGVEVDRQEESMLNRCAVIVIEKYKAAYPELATDEMYREITKEIWKEEVQFAHALDHGMKEFEKMSKNGGISGEDAFLLFTTYGFPFEMTVEIAQERNLPVDEADFHARMQVHQDLSRIGSEQKFKGGLADHSEATTRLHTAHHLLLKALQIVLGPEVKQRGSNITAERLRIDFSYGAKMTPEQIAEVERIVNEKIAEELPVTRSTLPKEEAEKLGAEHEFGAKYPDMVSVYSIGPKDTSIDDPRFDQAYSIEFCGGPHVSNTRDLQGTFKIVKEESVASGTRRIKALLV